MGRLEAGRALVKTAKARPDVAKALAAAWKREKSPPARREMCELICDGDETFRAALIEAAHDADARVRVAAIAGLAKLKHDDQSENIPPRGLDQPQRSLRRAHQRLARPGCLESQRLRRAAGEGLEISADHHSIAATALELSLETPGAKSRELAALYSKYGQPESLRSTAIGAFSHLAKDDPLLQDVLIELADDNDRSVRLKAWNAVRDLKVKKALPVLEARLARESADFGGTNRQVLKEAIETLKETSTEPKEGVRPPAEQTNTSASAIADLERQEAELEKKTKELRSQITALKQESERGAQPATNGGGTGSAHTSP